MKKFIIYLSTISFFFLLNPQTCFSQFGFVGKSKAWIKTNLQDVWTLKNTNTSNDGTEYESYINPRNGDEMTFYYNSKGFCSKIIIFTKYDNLTSFTNHFNKTCVSIGFLKWVNEVENTYIEFNIDMQYLGLLVISLTPFK